jgi:hypothetical protein
MGDCLVSPGNGNILSCKTIGKKEIMFILDHLERDLAGKDIFDSLRVEAAFSGRLGPPI